MHQPDRDLMHRGGPVAAKRRSYGLASAHDTPLP